MTAEQAAPTNTSWAPSDVIHRLGKEINDESSVYYWCYKVCFALVSPSFSSRLVSSDPTRVFGLPFLVAFPPPTSLPSSLSLSSSLILLSLSLSSLSFQQNNIPVFCPALTDGSLGDMLYFHSYKTSTPLVIDIVRDIRRLNDMSVKSKRAGMIILGGGVCKHQIANAMLFVSFLPLFSSLSSASFSLSLLHSFVLMKIILVRFRSMIPQRNGADYAVYMNTGNEYDGSDSGARTDEAVSWGKIKADAKQVKVSLPYHL